MTDANATKGSQPSKASGKFHETKGDLKETLGRTFGKPGMQQSGAQERAAGQAEYQAASGQGSYAQGTKDRLGGKKDQVLGSLTADRSQQTQGNERYAQGAAQQNWNRTS